MMLLIISGLILQINAQVIASNASYFLCDSWAKCNFDMYCINGVDCTVICSGQNGCKDGAIHPPNAGNLTVVCTNMNACNGLTIAGPTTGSLTLTCGGKAGCGNVNAICPVFGDCIVKIISYHSTNAMTVDASNMISGALQVADLQSSTVHCPQNYLECDVNCVSASCAGSTFHTKNDSILRIFATGASALQNSIVHCALLADCSITMNQPVSNALSNFKLRSIDGIDGFNNMTVEFICDYASDISECYAANDPPQLWCGSTYNKGCAMVNTGHNAWECQHMTSDELCLSDNILSGYYAKYFLCDSWAKCNYQMYCIDGVDCTAMCSGHNGCIYGGLHPPDGAKFTVVCTNMNACNGLTIAGPTNDSFTLTCGGNGGCAGVNAICPIFGDCTVQITSYHSSNAMTVDGSNMISGTLQVIDIQSSTIKCPGNNLQCVVNCISASCKGVSITTKDDSSLRIFATGASALQNSIIHCALSADCSITVSQPTSNALSNFKLRSIDGMDGFVNITFICEYASDISECYAANDPPQLWCGLQYNKGCAMVNTGHNAWECEHMTSNELCTSDDIWSGYYGSYFLCDSWATCDFDMYCINGVDCTAMCSGHNGCTKGAIHPPNVGNLTVICSSTNACYGMTLAGPTNGSYTLTCGGNQGCRSASIICPIFGDCIVEITSSHSTNIITVDASNMKKGKLRVAKLQSSTIHCPGNRLECVADCVANPCTGTSFHAKNDSILRVFASQISDLQSVNIYGSLNANCSITVDCGAQHRVVCNMELSTGSSYDGWRCNVPGSNDLVNFVDLCSTTNPTSVTTEPTTNPTANPTADPTVAPTTDPTTNQTADPSHSPTANPAFDPTLRSTVDFAEGEVNEKTTAFDVTDEGSQGRQSQTLGQSTLLLAGAISAAFICVITAVIVNQRQKLKDNAQQNATMMNRAVDADRNKTDNAENNALELQMKKDVEEGVVEGIALEHGQTNAVVNKAQENVFDKDTVTAVNDMHAVMKNDELEDVVDGHNKVTPGDNMNGLLQEDEFVVIGDDEALHETAGNNVAHETAGNDGIGPEGEARPITK